MKKKLFSLLTLALLGMSSAWAETATISWTDMAISNHDANKAGTASNASLIPANGVVNGLITNGTVTKDFGAGSTTYYRYKGFDTAENTSLYFEYSFTTAAGYSFTPSKLSVGWAPNGGKAVEFNVYAGTSSENLIKIGELKHASDNTYSVDNITVDSEFSLVRLVPFGKASSIILNSVTITGDLVNTTMPNLNVSTGSVKLAVNPITTSKNATFTLTGMNLTNGTYDLTVPTVAGLSVTPTSFTVAEGTVNQEFTVTYTSTANVAEAIANITANVDGIEAKVAVTYSSIGSLYSQTSITGATTWDWSKYGVANIATSGIDGIYREEVLVANVEFYGFDAPDAAFGPAQSIVLNGDNIVRDSKYCQVSSVKFTTTVPGMLKVVFSNTGGSRPNRYLLVNGENTGFGSNSTSQVTAQNIYIPAGDVVLTNIIDPTADESFSPGSSSFIRIYSIAFTLLPASTNVAVTDAGYRTFASKYPLDFTGGVSGLKAYKATVAGSTVTFSEVTGKVPAGEGLLLKAAEGSYTIPVASTEPAAIDNALVGVTTTTEKEAGIYVLMNGAKGLGFYKTTAAFTVGANTAYLPADVAGARTFIGFNDDETTGIESMNIEHSTMNAEHYYDLQGRRVAQPTKGLYILNGKKVFVN